MALKVGPYVPRSVCGAGIVFITWKAVHFPQPRGYFLSIRSPLCVLAFLWITERGRRMDDIMIQMILDDAEDENSNSFNALVLPEWS